MGPEDFDKRLRESEFFRSAMTDLRRASEQALAIVALALARQGDAGRLAADVLALQQAAAADNPSPTRDLFLNTIRSHLPRVD